MMSVGGVFKRIMELAIFGIGWQTAQVTMQAPWMALFLIYLFYIAWEIYNENVSKIKAREAKNTPAQV